MRLDGAVKVEVGDLVLSASARPWPGVGLRDVVVLMYLSCDLSVPGRPLSLHEIQVWHTSEVSW